MTFRVPARTHALFSRVLLAHSNKFTQFTLLWFVVVSNVTRFSYHIKCSLEVQQHLDNGRRECSSLRSPLQSLR